MLITPAWEGLLSLSAWLAILSAICFFGAIWITQYMRQFALRRQIVDEVNERSSHQVPTPRGGGVSIVVISLCGIMASSIWFEFPVTWAAGFLGGGMSVALVGWIDDHGHVSSIVRLIVHISAAVWVTFWIGLPSFEWLGWPVFNYAAVIWFCTVLAIGWLINLFNFMDGIDGLAASEAASVTLGGAVLIAGSTASLDAAFPLVLMSAATLGFLWWNWPPARIFMGDASSGFLGLTVGGMVLVGWQVAPALGVAMAILPAVFVSDATFTLLRRIAKRERVYEAHRTHAYQHMAIRIGRHLPVTLGVLAINWLFLFPLAWLTATGGISLLAGLALAYFPLLACAYALGAGRPDLRGEVSRVF